MLRTVLLAGLIITLVASLVTIARPTPLAYACTGAYPPFDEVALAADAVAILRAVEVGGPDYTIGPITPVPAATLTASPSATSEARPSPSATPLARPARFDLTGFGARMQPESVLIGSLPQPVDLDAAVRLRMETELRRLETGRYILPCAVDFLVPHYEQGARYLLFLNYEDGGWLNSPPMFTLDASNRVTGEWFQVSRVVYEAFLEEYHNTEPHYVTDNGQPWPPEKPLVSLDKVTVPLTTFVEALRLARGEIPAPSPTPSRAPIDPPGIAPTLSPSPSAAPASSPIASPAAGPIAPPSVGDAGLVLP